MAGKFIAPVENKFSEAMTILTTREITLTCQHITIFSHLAYSILNWTWDYKRFRLALGDENKFQGLLGSQAAPFRPRTAHFFS